MLLELAEIFPEAPIYTLLYDEEKMGGRFAASRVRPSFLQCLPVFFRRHHQYLLPLFPSAVENFDLRDFDLVISSSSAFAKGVVTRPKTCHLNYCHNPARFLWDYSFSYLEEQSFGRGRQLLARLAFNYLRLWDRAASQRVDYFVANSRATAERIAKYYRREAKIIFPPVNLANNQELLANSRDANAEEYFLIVSQLTPYKKVDVAVEAFNRLNLPLIVIGEGPQAEYLQNLAKENVRILGWRPDEEVAEYYKNCFAFIFPGEDDFGIAPVEAMGWGKPVLAFRAGGAQETVLPAMTGEFFDAPTPEVLADGVRRLRENYKNYSPIVIRKWAEKFSKERFRSEMMEFIKKLGYNQSKE